MWQGMGAYDKAYRHLAGGGYADIVGRGRGHVSGCGGMWQWGHVAGCGVMLQGMEACYMGRGIDMW